MRVFWVLLSLAVVGGLVFVLAPAGGGGKPTAAPVATPSAGAPVANAALAPTAGAVSATSPAASQTAESTSKPPTTAPVPVQAPAAAAVAKPVSAPAAASPQAPTAATPAPTAPNTAADSLTAVPEPTPASLAAEAAVPAAPTVATDAKSQPNTTSTPAGIPAGPATPSPNPTKTPAAPQAIPGITDGTSGTSGDGMFAKALEAAAPGEPVTLPEHPVFKGEKSLPSKAVRKADGSLLVDDRFVVKGSGTAADPYIVPWDMIVSAQETYKPRLGMTKIPQRVSMLNGKYIKIVGFIAFPITAASPKEALIMLNQWDGCCIGTPPSPYDAIEVKLAAPATGGQKTMASGTITGIFKVDPYEDGGWLLGLYLMEDATLTAGEAL